MLTKADASVIEATSMHLRKTEGTVAIKDKDDNVVEAREQLGLYNGYNVATDTVSFAWIDLDSVKLTKMDEDSQVSIEKDGKNLKIQLESGNLFFHVTEPLGGDESMEIRTSTMAIGIRGTCGWVETSEETSKVYLLEGGVEVENSDGSERATVNAGEFAVVNEDGTIVVASFDPAVIPTFVLDERDEDDALKQMIEGLFADGSRGTVVGENDEKQVVEEEDIIYTMPIDEGDGTKIDISNQEWIDGSFTFGASVDIYSSFKTKCGYTKPNITVSGVAKAGEWIVVPFSQSSFYMKTADFEKAVGTKVASAKTGNTGNTGNNAQNNKNSNNSGSGQTAAAQTGNTNQNTGNQTQTPAQTQPTAPTEPVVPTPAPVEPTPEPATPAYSEAEVIAIYKSTLEAAGMQWYPSSDLYASCPEFGLDGGMGWYIADVSMDYPQSDAADSVVSLQVSGYNMFYIESQGASDGYVSLKIYRGTIK